MEIDFNTENLSLSVGGRFERGLHRAKNSIAVVDWSTLRFFLGPEQSTWVVKPIWDLEALVAYDRSMTEAVWINVAWFQDHPEYDLGKELFNKMCIMFCSGVLREQIVGPNIARYLQTVLNANGSPVRYPFQGVQSIFSLVEVDDKSTILIRDRRTDGQVHWITFGRSLLLRPGFNPIEFVQQTRNFQAWVVQTLADAAPFPGDNDPRVLLRDPSITIKDWNRWSLNGQSLESLEVYDKRRGACHRAMYRLFNIAGFSLGEFITARYLMAYESFVARQQANSHSSESQALRPSSCRQRQPALEAYDLHVLP